MPSSACDDLIDARAPNKYPMQLTKTMNHCRHGNRHDMHNRGDNNMPCVGCDSERTHMVITRISAMGARAKCNDRALGAGIEILARV